MTLIEKKTASKWYQDDKDCDILDPDGWDRSTNRNGVCQGCIDWFTKPITFHEYNKKREKCTITSYMRNNHNQPFEE